MILWLPLILGLFIFRLDFIHSFSEWLHSLCLLRIDTKPSNYKEIYKALLCGARLTKSGDLKEIFSHTGLIHLMVVSGAHLLFLERMWNMLPQWSYKSFFVTLSLILYTLVAKNHPPIFRALVAYFLLHLSYSLRLFWSPQWRVMLSGIVCLIINPNWISSISLQMSWIGALVFTFSSYSRIMTHCLCYVALLPIISQWMPLHPLTILLNWILFPVISITLFPLSILSFFVPIFYTISDLLWTFIIQFLAFIQPYLQKSLFYIEPMPRTFIWVYIGILFFLFQSFWIFLKKKEIQ